MNPLAIARMQKWFAALPETPGKQIAREIAADLDANGESSAKALLASKNLMKWEQLAICEMVAAISHAVHKGVKRGSE